MRFDLKASIVLGLLTAVVSGGAAQALPPVIIQVQSQPAGDVLEVTPATTASDTAQTTPVAIAASPVHRSILDLSNQARQDADLNMLSFSAELNAAAQRHANDLANGAKFSHRGSDGSTMQSRIKDAGYDYWTIAENIYFQAPRNRPERAVQGWLKSPGHRRNLLNSDFTEMGVGYATNGRDHYYVQVFGTPQ